MVILMPIFKISVSQNTINYAVKLKTSHIRKICLNQSLNKRVPTCWVATFVPFVNIRSAESIKSKFNKSKFNSYHVSGFRGAACVFFGSY